MFVILKSDLMDYNPCRGGRAVMNLAEWAFTKSINLTFALIPQPLPSPSRLAAARLVAHRGVHETGLALENSQKAFDLCLENKIWAAELDVRFTADNVPIVVHDENGLRNWRQDITFASATFADVREKIPGIMTLAEVVARYGRKLHLMIEIKENHASRPDRVEVLAGTLAPLRPLEDYHLLALEPKILEPLNFAPKSCYLDVIWLDAGSLLRENRELNHGAVAGHFLFFSQARIDELRGRDVAVGVGFLESRNSLLREINRGVSFIFTDCALRLQKILTGLAPNS